MLQLKMWVYRQSLFLERQDTIVAGSRNQLYGVFTFDAGWDTITNRVAQFADANGKRYDVPIVNGSCKVPWEVIQPPQFTVAVYGGDYLPTSSAAVQVAPCGVGTNGVPGAEPTPLLYDRLMSEIAAGTAEAKQSAATAAAEQAKSTQAAGVSVEQSQAAANNKRATDQNKADTDRRALEAQQMAVLATEQQLLAKRYADQAQSIASAMPMRYYRKTETEMEQIAKPLQGDLCYVTDFAAAKSRLYVYDATDLDADSVNPEWVFLGNLEFANLDRASLLGLLQLAPVALSGSYLDLSNRPARYRAPITLDAAGAELLWDYALSDNAVVTLTQDKPIRMTGLYPGAQGNISVYGAKLTLPKTNPMLNMLTPLSTEHAVYSFYSRDGAALDWTMLPYEGATV